MSRRKLLGGTAKITIGGIEIVDVGEVCLAIDEDMRIYPDALVQRYIRFWTFVKMKQAAMEVVEAATDRGMIA